MKVRRPDIKITINEIVEYWSYQVYEGDLSIDFSEAHERCWRCGYKSKLHKCHIIPYTLNGKDIAENLVLMCRRCHREAPNIDDKDFFWDWLKAQRTSFYDAYWTIRGAKEYEFIYNESVEAAFQRCGVKDNHLDKVEELMKSAMQKTIIHFGEGRLNPSTIAGVFRNIIIDFERKYCA